MRIEKKEKKKTTWKILNRTNQWQKVNAETDDLKMNMNWEKKVQ